MPTTKGEVDTGTRTRNPVIINHVVPPAFAAHIKTRGDKSGKTFEHGPKAAGVSLPTRLLHATCGMFADVVLPAFTPKNSRESGV